MATTVNLQTSVRSHLDLKSEGILCVCEESVTIDKNIY